MSIPKKERRKKGLEEKRTRRRRRITTTARTFKYETKECVQEVGEFFGAIILSLSFPRKETHVLEMGYKTVHS